MWIQHDGIPAHSARIFRLKMQEIFPQKWIGEGTLTCSFFRFNVIQLFSMEFH